MVKSEESKSDWVVESNVKLLNRLLIGIGFLGMVLISLTRNRLDESKAVLAAFWAGVLLISVAAGVWIFFERTQIRVNRRERNLLVQKKSLLGNREYILPFERIQSVNVIAIGRAHRGVVTYHLVLRLKTGEKEIPGCFSFSRSDISEISEKLTEEIGIGSVSLRSQNS